MLDGPQTRRRGRPPKPLDPTRSRAAFFGFEIRRLREGLDLSLEDLAKRAGCSAGHLGHLERGEVQASGPLVVALDRELKAKKRLRRLFPSVQLEWAAERHAKQARHHKAKQANGATPPFTVGARVSAQPSTIRSPRQRTDPDTRQDNEVSAPVEHDGRPESPQIGSADLVIAEELENITAGFRRLYHHVSADDILRGVVHHLGTTRLLKNQVAKSHRERLALTIGEVALLAGRLLSMDKSQHDAASPYYRVALRASAEARDHGLHAVVLGHISRLHDHRGELHNALDVLRQARRHAERTDNAIVVAWLAAVEARTHATAGNEVASLSAIDRAELVVEPVQAEQVPAWMDYFDRCRLQGFKGFCHMSLKRFDAADTALDRALSLLDPLQVKERACYLADVATVRAEQGEIEEGCRIIGQSLNMLSTTSYATGAERVYGFRARLPRTCRNLPAVRRLDEQLASMRR